MEMEEVLKTTAPTAALSEQKIDVLTLPLRRIDKNILSATEQRLVLFTRQYIMVQLKIPTQAEIWKGIHCRSVGAANSHINRIREKTGCADLLSIALLNW